jgi:hypothetical protein
MIGLDRNVSQKFPDFPDEDDGGSNKIFAQKTVEEVQEELEAVGYQFFIISIKCYSFSLETRK